MRPASVPKVSEEGEGGEGAGRPSALGEIARLFVKLGVIGFGGPAAHIALMREEVVRRRRWIDDGEFLDLVGATNLIPGPNSTELAIHIGHRRAGGRGLLTAGVSFIAPAVAIVGFLAWLYERFGTDPTIVDLRYGILPVIIGIIAHALYGLGRVAFTTPFHVLLTLAALAGYLSGVHELVLLVAAGTLTALWSCRDRLGPPPPLLMVVFPLVGDARTHPAPVSLWRILVIFLEVGSVLYGSGYVLPAFLQRNLVDNLGWLTSGELLDAIAVGQVTPGPLFSTATFVGWQIEGPAGAAVATLGIFVPSFILVSLLGRIVPWMRARPSAGAFLTGLTTASLGLMAGVLVKLTDAAIHDGFTLALAGSALALLVRTKLNAVWLVASGAALGAIHGVVV